MPSSRHYDKNYLTDEQKKIIQKLIEEKRSFKEQSILRKCCNIFNLWNLFSYIKFNLWDYYFNKELYKKKKNILDLYKCL